MKNRISIVAMPIDCNMNDNKQSKDENNKSHIVSDGYTEITLFDKSGENTYGISVELDPHFLSQNIFKGLVDEKDWEIVEQRVAKMEISRFRVMILPSWIEPFNDNGDSAVIDWNNLATESREMKSLCKVLDLAEKNGIDVNLTLWGAENNVALCDDDTMNSIRGGGGHFLAKGNNSSNWIIAARDPEEMAENFSIYIQYLVNKKGYTCIKEITPINEPDWSYLMNDKVEFENYKNLCLAIDARFKKDGIRDKVKFNLSDNTDNAVSWLEKTVTNLNDIADMYNSHTYIFGYDTTNTAMREWEIENLNNTRGTGKKHVVGEFGSNQNTGSSRQSDIDTYERGVLMTRQALNFYNAGAAGVSYWVLFDQYYSRTDSYDSMMQLGLWKSTKKSYFPDKSYYDTVKEDYEVRDQYYAYALLSKYVKRGADVYPIECGDEFVAGTAFKNSNGKWVYVFANGSEKNQKFAIYNPDNFATFDKFVYEKSGLPSNDGLLTSKGNFAVKNQVLEFELPANSVVLFNEI